jgi:Fe2+ transport system protein FeoA
MLAFEGRDATEEASTSAGHAPRVSFALTAALVGSTVEVIELALEAEMSAWLRAVGISEGELVTVLRAGAFGGPIHVRTGAGGEFALHRSLAASVITKTSAVSSPLSEETPP